MGFSLLIPTKSLGQPSRRVTCAISPTNGLFLPQSYVRVLVLRYIYFREGEIRVPMFRPDRAHCGVYFHSPSPVGYRFVPPFGSRLSFLPRNSYRYFGMHILLFIAFSTFSGDEG